MTTTAIRIENLSKTFGPVWRKRRVHAVKNLTLEVQAGQVYGFLGPNGAGKTTTIRMLLDLIRPNHGDVYLFGKHVRHERQVLRRVAAQVEDARFYPFMTGRRNLEVLALTANMTDYLPRIDALLEQVNLAERSRRRVSGYSTGMKARLGLAAALLSDPDLVIFDEPTNGLDPQGMQEVRHFIRELADTHGKTVFLSSHLLHEVEQICDRVAIINHGHMITEGSVADLVASKARLCLQAEPLEKAKAVLEAQWDVSQQAEELLIDATREAAPAIVEKLVAEGIKVYEITTQSQSLEEYFLAVTGEQHAG